MLHKLLSEQWQEGYDAHIQGEPLEDCPYPPATRDARDWREGWRASDHSDWADAMEARMWEARDVAS